MPDAALAILYALFVWWFATGLVFLAVLRRPAGTRTALVGAALLFPLCLLVLAKTSLMTSVGGAYLAFTAAVVLWGTQEIAFLSGVLVGPRPHPCPPGAVGLDRLAAALGAILYHELALLASSAAVVAVTWQAPNRIGALAFLVLWIMRVSAKINLFLGVPVLNDEVMPERITFLRTYFRRGAVNTVFPVSVVLAVAMTADFVTAATEPEASRAVVAGYSLLIGLTMLALAEHVFMLVPLPIAKLWRWSTKASAPATLTQQPRTDLRPAEVALTRP